MKKLFYLWMAVFLLSACGDDEKDEPVIPEPSSPITILTYLIADNNLSDYLSYNIITMYEGLAELNQSATLLVYWDGSSAIQGIKNPVILRYATDGNGLINGLQPVENASTEEVLALAEIVKEYPHQLSNQKDVMAKVLTDMVGLAPTEKVGLVAGSHGSAWIHTIFTNTSRSFGQDGSGTDNTILIADMADAMKSTGKIFDFLLFDACLMATGEVCYDLCEVTNYQIGSVLEIPAYGFPYDQLMDKLFTGTVDGYKQTCQSFIDYYRGLYNQGESSWGAISLVDCREMKNLAKEIRSEIIEHKDELADFSPKGLQEYGWYTASYISVDIRHFIKEINGGSVPAAFQSQLDKTIIYKDGLDDSRYYARGYDLDMSNYCGLGMYVPVVGFKNWNGFFKTIDWYSVVGWDQVSFSWNF